jgi:hypothetical protein
MDDALIDQENSEEVTEYEGILFETYEQEPKERTGDWYWTVGIFTVAICVISLIYGNVLFAILVFISAFTLLLSVARAPMLVEVEITPKGIRNNRKVYYHRHIESFWIEEEAHKNTLLLKLDKKMAHLISIPLGDVDVDVIREYLNLFITEEEMHESFGHKVLERLGF